LEDNVLADVRAMLHAEQAVLARDAHSAKVRMGMNRSDERRLLAILKV
jgi:hypothetical protein